MGALVLGIASVVCCGILGIPFGIGAIVTGTTSRKRIAASSGRLEGDGTALAGIIIGAIGLVLSTLATIYLFTNPDALNELVETLETTTTTSTPPR